MLKAPDNMLSGAFWHVRAETPVGNAMKDGTSIGAESVAGRKKREGFQG